MADYTPKLHKVAARALLPGERLLAGCRAMTKGSTAAIVAEITGGVVAGRVGASVGARLTADKVAEGRTQTDLAGIGHAAQVALGLTNQRLLVWKRGAFLGRPKRLIGAIPVEQIASIEGSASGSMLRPDPLTVTLTDGRIVEFEVVKIDGVDRIVTEFARLRGG